MAPAYIVFVGIFVHLPHNDSKTLAVQKGAVWVSTSDGRIKGTDWSLVNEDDLQSLLKKQAWVAEHASRCRSGTRVRIIRAREEQNEFFFPGFVDTHIHAPQYPISGIFGTSTLFKWLDTYVYPMEALFKSSLMGLPPPIAYKAYNQVISRTLANGTTFASYFATIHVPATNLLAKLCIKRGQRALIGRVCMDQPAYCPDYLRDASPQESIELNYRVIDCIRSMDPEGTMVKPIITPRFALSCTEEVLQGLGQLSEEYNLHIQTHASENTDEVEKVRCHYGMLPAEVYDKFNLLTPRTILAHGVYLTPSEQWLISDKGSKVSHCPISNSALASGICPVRELLRKNVTISLGTDVSGGYSPSVLEVVRQACLVSRLLQSSKKDHETNNYGSEHEKHKIRHSNDDKDCDDEGTTLVLTVEEALYLATRGGAAAVNMEKDIGGFEVGMYWDAQLIHLGSFMPAGKRGEAESRVDVFGWETWVERVHKWVWNGNDRNVMCVWVGGRLVYSQGDLEVNKLHVWRCILGSVFVGLICVVTIIVLRG